MSTMRAKLVVGSVSGNATSQSLIFNAVAKYNGYPADGSDEDNSFALWTPMARMEMTVNNPALIGKFAMGDKFYVDFTPVDAVIASAKADAFEYQLNQAVRVPGLGVNGVINGRAEYANGAPSYNVKFGDGDNATNMWLDGQFLLPAPDATEQQIVDEAAEVDIPVAEDPRQ